MKEDGVQAKVDEKLEFKVIEFNKSAKRIIVSHSRVFEDVKKSEERTKKSDEDKSAKKAVKQVKEKLEKTTLGDISELAALKEQMTADAKEQLTASATKKAKAAKEEKVVAEPVVVVEEVVEVVEAPVVEATEEENKD